MPLQRACSLDALRANISELIQAGHSRDEAVAIAHATLRESCASSGEPIPSIKDASAVVREFRRPRGQRSSGYLEQALAEAKKRLGYRDFAVIHQAAMSRAGGTASARIRATPTEKAFVSGASSLNEAELSEAIDRAGTLLAAELRAGVSGAGLAMAEGLWSEQRRRLYADGAAARTEATAKADRSADPGVMVAMRLPESVAKAITIPGGEPADRLHVTLAYLGRMSEVGIDGLALAQEAIEKVSRGTPVLKGVLAGIGRFAATESSDGKDVVIALVDVPGVSALRASVMDALKCSGLAPREAHDFTPHVTLAYVEPGAAMPEMPEAARLGAVYFDCIALSVNDVDTDFALGQGAEAGDQDEDEANVIVDEILDDASVMASTYNGGTITLASNGHDLEPGDMVALSVDASGGVSVKSRSSATVPDSEAWVQRCVAIKADKARHETPIPFVGPSNARLVFVSGAPGDLELARMEPLVGEDGAEFQRSYLDPIGVKKSEVALGFACPVVPRVPAHEIGEAETKPWEAHLQAELARFPGAHVIAIGKAAASALCGKSLLWLPHPLAARANSGRYSEQIERKIKRIRKSLDDGFVFADDDETQSMPDGVEILAGRIGETLESGPGRVIARVSKAAKEKQIVYGVVLDPYEIDTQDEWVPPSVVEKSAHDYLKKSRVIGREHVRQDRADLVESWVVHYPSKQDYEQAMSLQPHKAYVMPYGDDKVHSGAWIAGVQLSDDGWSAYQRGEITGFSIGGYSAKSPASRGDMPKVEFVELLPR